MCCIVQIDCRLLLSFFIPLLSPIRSHRSSLCYTVCLAHPSEQFRLASDFLQITSLVSTQYHAPRTTAANHKMHLPTLLSLLLSTLPLTLAASLRISIPPYPGLPNPSTLPPSTHAVLLGPVGISHDVPIRKANDFLFRDLEPAGYLLTVHARDYVFPPLRIDVSGEGEGEGEKVEAWQTFRGNEWSNKGPSYGSTTGGGELHVLLSPTGGKEYYQPRGGFNVLSFLKSPMILMGLVSVVFIFGLPYLMDNSKFTGGVDHLVAGRRADAMYSGPRDEG